MKVKFVRIRGAGALDAERLVLRVTGSTDIGEFAVFRAEASENSVTNEVTNTFWFPNQSVRAGDLVVVYTKPGVQKERVNESGSTSYFYYWGLNRAIWGTKDFVPVVLHIDEWISAIKLISANSERDAGEA